MTDTPTPPSTEVALQTATQLIKDTYRYTNSLERYGATVALWATVWVVAERIRDCPDAKLKHELEEAADRFKHCVMSLCRQASGIQIDIEQVLIGAGITIDELHELPLDNDERARAVVWASVLARAALDI